MDLKSTDNKAVFGIEFPTDKEYFVVCNPIHFDKYKQASPWNAFESSFHYGTVDSANNFVEGTEEEPQFEDDLFTKGQAISQIHTGLHDEAESWKLELKNVSLRGGVPSGSAKPITITFILKKNNHILQPQMFFCSRKRTKPALEEVQQSLDDLDLEKLDAPMQGQMVFMV